MARKQTNLSLVKKLKEGLDKIRGSKEPVKEPGIPVVITSYSQPHVLQHKMRERELTHDQEVMASIGPVRLESNFGKMVLYFCPMQTLDIVQELKPGDGGAIPSEAIVREMEAPKNIKPGLYTLKNVKLHSNGVMSVTATPKTEWVAETC